ncbi:MAG: amidohydrolase family protein [Rikenellaceae bacterium]
MNCCHSPRRRIASNLMLMDGKLISRPLLEIDNQGTILSVATYSQVDRLQFTEFYSGIITPGFVNAHCHLELSYLQGRIPPYQGFAAFARAIGEVRGEASEQERRRAITSADIKLRNEGVVAVGDILNGTTSMDCKEASPVRYRNFGELFGLRTTSVESMAWVEEYANSSITPHSIYSLNDAVFREIATRDVSSPLSIHFMESPAEAELYERRGRLWDWYESVGFECDFLHYGSPAERIVQSVPSDRSVILVHNCCVTQPDIDIIMSHFTAPVYWALCPCSNDYISHLAPPVELLRKNDLNICIGTDSLASNESVSMMREMLRIADVPLGELLDWATRQGAQSLGFDDLGRIEVGRRPGINVISGIDYKSMSLTTGSQVLKLI